MPDAPLAAAATAPDENDARFFHVRNHTPRLDGRTTTAAVVARQMPADLQVAFDANTIATKRMRTPDASVYEALAEAKLALLSAKSKDGGSLIDWNEDEANAMFSMVEPQTEQKGTAPGA